MRSLLYLVPILLCFLASTVNCQDGEGESNSLLDKLCKLWNTVWNGMKDLCNEFWDEFNYKLEDFRGMTQQMWNTMKDKMKDWVDSKQGMDESKKIEMREYIERLKMPED